MKRLNWHVGFQQRVSLYSLERATRLHRDTLERLCGLGQIPIEVHFEEVSTPRYLVRKVEAEDVPRLMRRVAGYRRNRRKREDPARRAGVVPPVRPGWPYIGR